MITRYDVAKKAGVSKTTVSRVLNDSDKVSAETKKLVCTAIKELDYSPNLLARGLKTNRSYQILFYTHNLMNPFYAQVYETIEKHVYKYGYSVVVSSKCSVKTVNQRGYDGVIIAHQDDELIKTLKKSSIPYVVINYTSTQRDILEVNIDINNGIKQVSDILNKYGHDNIGYITKLADDKRFSVFRRSLNSSCILTNAIVSEGNDDYDIGYEAAKKLHMQRKDITAIFAFNDCMAMGAMNAYVELGKRIPEDISFIGFDNIVQSKYTNPPLTSISIPIKKIGQKAAEMLMIIIDGKKTESICLDTELCIRKSVDRTSGRKAE